MDIYFAPLQGYTQAEYRRLHSEIYGGVDFYCTPFIRVENGDVRSKDISDIKQENNKGINLIPQVIASDAKDFQLIVDAIVSHGYKHIDFNMGCPFPLQTKRGRGAGILSDISRVKEILSKMSDYADVTFSLKMRTGMFESEECIKLLPVINEAPLKYVVMHPRLGKQQYKGNVDLSVFSEFMSQCCHKMIYNGDIRTVEDIEKIQKEFPQLDGIMIGRGLLSRPSLATEYKENKIKSREERIELLMKFHGRLYLYYSGKLQGDAHLLAKMKTFWDYADVNTVDKKILKSINKSVSIVKYNAAMKMIFHDF